MGTEKIDGGPRHTENADKLLRRFVALIDQDIIRVLPSGKEGLLALYGDVLEHLRARESQS